ncbi:hypothetical protein GCM10007384_36530 [Aquimarina muelleri]|uniref:Uncharacterized protein n=2 Tax=Aquimarina muelleri TaxID=279356 RepID=A0A918JZ27_9FLAO|nr:hypothetical protein GCM10007384_36530 [Aquimarina muelleri]
MSCNSQEKTITQKELDVERAKLTDVESKILNNTFEYVSDMSLKELKIELHNNLQKWSKVEFKEKLFLKTNILIEDEEYSHPFQLYLEGIKKQIKVLKETTTFEQNFKNDTAFISFDAENKYKTGKYFKDTYKAQQIYYRSKDNHPKFKEGLDFSLDYSEIAYGKAKYIDSVVIKARFDYVTKYDTIVFCKDEMLQKQNFKINDIKGNYVYFEVDNNERFMQFEAYNEEGKKLSYKDSFNYHPGTYEKIKEEELILIEEKVQSIQITNSLSEAMRILEKLWIDLIIKGREKNAYQYSFRGNVDKVKFYIEKERKDDEFIFTAKDMFPSSFYLNEKNNETWVMSSKSNKLLFKLPETNLDFLKYDNFNQINSFYLAKDNNDGSEQYYYLNVEKQIFTKTDKGKAITENLVLIYGEGDLDAIYDNDNNNVSGFKYLEVETYRHNNKCYIIGKQKDRTYVLINSNGKEIGSISKEKVLSFSD